MNDQTERDDLGSEGAAQINLGFPPKWPRVAGVTAVIDVLIAMVIAALAAITFQSIAGNSHSPGNFELLSARRVEVFGMLVLVNAFISGVATHYFLSNRSFITRFLAVISLGACLVFAAFIFLDALFTAGQMPGGDWAGLIVVYPFLAAVVITPLCVSGFLHFKALSKLADYAGPKPDWPIPAEAALFISIGLGTLLVGVGGWQIHSKEMRGMGEDWAQLQEKRAEAGVLLDQIKSGEATQEELIGALQVQDIRVRDEAIARLSVTESAPAVPALVEVLKHGALGNADRAALQLGLIGEPALPLLTELLGDAEARVRMRASLGLGEMGTTATPAVPELLRALDDEDEKVRAAVRVALGWIDPGALPATEQAGGKMTVTRISVAGDGTQSDGPSRYPTVSADGRVVAFYSEASNLVPNDEEGRRDIFVCDLASGSLERIPAADAGYEVYYNKEGPSLSADGRFVAFASNALRLIPKSARRGRKGRAVSNIFVYDRETGTIEWVPVPKGIIPNRRSPEISADGRFVAFVGQGLEVYNRETKSLESHALGIVGSTSDGHTQTPSISGDGRFVAFLSKASDLVDGDHNDKNDVFVFDRETGTVEGIEVGARDRAGLYDRSSPVISADGRFVSFVGNVFTVIPDYPEELRGRNDSACLFVTDREDGSVQLIAADGVRAYGGEPALSRDGRFVAFISGRGVFVYDRQSGSVQRLPAADHGCGPIERRIGSSRPAISSDGTVVAFSSANFFLVPGDTNWVEDIFVVTIGRD